QEMQRDVRLVADHPTVVRHRRDVEHVARFHFDHAASSNATVARPETTIPTCSTGQRVAPRPGPTCSLHFQPGSYVARPIVMPPRCTSSNLPLSIVRISSGESKSLRITSSDGACIRVSRAGEPRTNSTESPRHG